MVFCFVSFRRCFTTRVLWWQQNVGKKWKQPGRLQRNLLRHQNPVSWTKFQGFSWLVNLTHPPRYLIRTYQPLVSLISAGGEDVRGRVGWLTMTISQGRNVQKKSPSWMYPAYPNSLWLSWSPVTTFAPIVCPAFLVRPGLCGGAGRGGTGTPLMPVNLASSMLMVFCR